MGILDKFKKNKAIKVDIVQAAEENEIEPLKTLVWYRRGQSNYLMYLGTAIQNKTNPVPPEEWFADHFEFTGSEGDTIQDYNAGLRYSNNFKFKFTPTRLPLGEQTKKEQPEAQSDSEEDDITYKNWNMVRSESQDEGVSD